MTQEFNVENLLFLYEISQFKMKLMGIYMDKHKLEDIYNDVIFPSNIPKSEIIMKMNTGANETNTKINALLDLCIKYIFDESEFQVNISYKQRCYINSFFGINTTYYAAANVKRNKSKYFDAALNSINSNEFGINISNLFTLFDDAKREIIQLIGYSWDMFRKNAEIIELLGQIVSK